MNTSGLNACNSNWRSLGTHSPHWYTALSVIPSSRASLETLPKNEIADSVFIDALKHTLPMYVKGTLINNVYHRSMSTLEERVLEVIEAACLSEKVSALAERIGVTKQSVYDWKKGKSVGEMKGKYLVKLAEISGYEAYWIMEGKGPKKKTLTDEQKRVLVVMQQSEAKQNLVSDLVDSVLRNQQNHDDNTVDDTLVMSDHVFHDKPTDKRKRK